MRVISGSAKGKRLAPLKGTGIRPTSDKIRQAIFNILGLDWTEIVVLDLFAGTGALGIEALSRGARSAVFVDNHPCAIEIIRKNLEACGFSGQRVFRGDPLRGLQFLAKLGTRFSLVFVDPPYGSGMAQKTLDLLAGAGFLELPGIIVVESDKDDQICVPPGLEPEEEGRLYGRTKINFLRKAK